MKKYINAELTIVSIKNDIITDSMGVNGNYGTGEGITLGAPDRWDRFDYE